MSVLIDRTPIEALDLLLHSRLQFGNVDQIDSLYTLRIAEDLIGTEYKCSWCDGKGTVKDDEPGYCEKCGHECDYCGGEGNVKCDECDGTGLVEYMRDTVYRYRTSAIEKLRIERKAA